MEEFEYLESMDNDELINLINEMLDFEEVTKALMVLEERDEKKALVLGRRIINYNLGDDYLQATVWNILFDDAEIEMIKAMEEREEIIGKALLDEIITDLTNCKIDVCREFFERIINRYSSLSIDEKVNMQCDYDQFIGKYKNFLEL